MDPVRRRRVKIFAVMVALFAAAAIVAGLLVPVVTGAWRQRFLRSPDGVPYSPEGAVKKTIDRLKGD